MLVFATSSFEVFSRAENRNLTPSSSAKQQGPPLSAGEPLIIMDAYADARFNTEIDRKTGARPGGGEWTSTQGRGSLANSLHRMSHFIHICRGSPRLVVLVLKAFERLQVFEVKSGISRRKLIPC